MVSLCINLKGRQSAGFGTVEMLDLVSVEDLLLLLVLIYFCCVCPLCYFFIYFSLYFIKYIAVWNKNYL